MPLSIRSALLGAALVTALSTAASGVGRTLQQDQTPPPPIFRTEANYVRVDVFATRNDAPVTDLGRDDFEVLDNGVLQKIEQFEHVLVRAAGPQESRIEPSTVRESRAMLESSRARVVVVFLDTHHVGVGGSYNIRRPLIDALDRAVGPEDLVGVMTPDMGASDITFIRKTTTIEGFLTRYWHWGERDRVNPPDPVEQRYEQCYPGIGPTPICPDDDRGVAREMMLRRREKRTMDALSDLVRFLRGVREERKAVIAITDGWLLYRPNPTLARRLFCTVPTGPRVGIDPRTGKLAIGTPSEIQGSSECDNDRILLSQIDNERDFRELLDAANRSNTSFYPVDPRGLAVFDTDIGPAPPPPIAVDAAMLRARITSLRTLAEATDGLAIVNSNDLAGGLKRVVADLTSYYLLGYYASGKLDGRFHSITVRVKRPGVHVRARRGYLAVSERDVAAAARAAAMAGPAAPSAAEAAEARVVESAIAPLENYARPIPLRMLAAAGWKPDGAAAVWAIGELSADPEWRGGGEADLTLITAAGSTIASAHVSLLSGVRTFRVALAPERPLVAGEYAVRIRVKGAAPTASSTQTMKVVIPEPSDAIGAVFIRRGPATANREVPTADLRFRRNEQLRIEAPTSSPAPAAARLLDRTGKPLTVPVATELRDDPDGSRWQVARLALAPMAAGDYVVELSSEGKRTLFGFRVVP